MIVLMIVFAKAERRPLDIPLSRWRRAVYAGESVYRLYPQQNFGVWNIVSCRWPLLMECKSCVPEDVGRFEGKCDGGGDYWVDKALEGATG